MPSHVRKNPRTIDLPRLSPRNRLKVVTTREPYAALAQKLTGDKALDRLLVLDFCNEHKVSFRTAVSRLRPYSQTARHLEALI